MVSFTVRPADPGWPSFQGSCRLCGQQVPFDEVTVPEAMDYLMYFCGLGCYEQWRRAATAAFDPTEGVAP